MPKIRKDKTATPPATAVPRSVWIALLVATAFGTCALGFRPVFDNDIGIHIGVGRTIWETRSVPGVDFHSHTAPGAAFLDHEWLARLAFYALDRAAGVPGLVTFQGLLVLLAFGLIAWDNREHRAAVALMLLLAGIVVSTRVQVRPHVIAWVFIALQLRFHKRGRYLATAALLALWANVHGSFVLGLAMALIDAAEDWWDDRDPRRFAHAAALVAAPMLNPFGPKIYGFAGQIKDINFFVSEWQPYEWTSGYAWVLIAVFAAIAVDIVRRSEHRFFDAARVAFLGYLSWSAMRHGSESMLFLTPIFARRYGPWLARAPRRLAVATVLLVASCAAAGGVTLIAQNRAFDLKLDLHALPVRAVDFLNRAQPVGELYNDYNFGGYLLWKLDPRRKVFVDGRLEVYGPGGHLDEYLRVSNGAPGWPGILDRYRVNTCVVRADRPIAQQLDKSGVWEMVYFDYNAAVFLRQGTSPHIRRITNFRPWGHRDRNAFTVLIDEARYLLGLNPDFFGGFKMLAFVLYRAGDFAGARDNMREYLRLYSDGMDSQQTRDMLGNLSLRGFGQETTHGAGAGADVVPMMEKD